MPMRAPRKRASASSPMSWIGWPSMTISPRCGPFEPGHRHQQRRFAAARGARQADRRAAADGQADALQDMHPRRARAEAEFDVSQFDGGSSRVRRRRGRGAPGRVDLANREEPSCGSLGVRRHMGPGAGSRNSQPRWSRWPRRLGAAQAKTLKLVAFGDSLTAGYGVKPGQRFPEVLQAALRAKGCDVSVVNAGVSGETAEDGLARFDWSVPADTDALIVELGANDMLRGMAVDGAKRALSAILAKATHAAYPDAADRHAGGAQSRAGLRRGVQRDLPRPRQDLRRRRSIRSSSTASPPTPSSTSRTACTRTPRA